MTDIPAAESPRALEMRAIAHVTSGLQRAMQAGATPMDRVKALYWNSRMWAIFVADLSSSGNLLPAALRGNYISLGLFVQRESAAAMAGTRDIGLLVAINHDLLEALSVQSAPLSRPRQAHALPQTQAA